MKREKKNQNKQAERRKYPRIKKTLSLTLKGRGVSQVTKTTDISGSGVYCEVSQPLPEFSKLDVILRFPLTQDGKTSFSAIHCNGAVVRSERILRENGTPKKFFVAIYFTKLNPRNRVKLCRYVSKMLPKH